MLTVLAVAVPVLFVWAMASRREFPDTIAAPGGSVHEHEDGTHRP